ncbi:MAG: DUF4301 domain-containing protein [Bacteroidetes bacterium HGW-Bacteroidetes-21]|nr:MAG: DUF4301 domain-containing protein [Bacteroidetes bacterium HGW-Bacteroidetes-21]
MFREEDIQQMEKKGISLKEVEKQLSYFRQGFPFLQLDKPAIINDGVVKPDENAIQEAITLYEKSMSQFHVCKFVPASGAASRMFKDLYAFAEEDPGLGSATLFKQYPSVQDFADRIKDFAFYNDLKSACQKKQTNIDNVKDVKYLQQIIQLLLGKDGLDYGFLPKGLLAFHRYTEEVRTSFEEHLAEGALYAKNQDGTVYIHFTVTPDHLPLFQALFEKVGANYEKKYNVTYKIEYSIQAPSTDTIAVDEQNEPFREKDGRLVFRPAGHGALLHNLDRINSPLIFIKNIDNIVPDSLKTETVKYKKLIAGILLQKVSSIHAFLKRIELQENEAQLIDEITHFYKVEFHLDLKKEQQNITHLRKLLNRPVRICGMVKNLGEPGGGPYWALNAKLNSLLQIVESSQVNLRDAGQKQIFNSSTHFNPVDLVCFVNNFKGEKFNLVDFSDPETGFISVKSKDGRPLKAMELPGLWNGAMSDWNTLFVEVPLITFNPVKSVNDLLRKEHLTR